MANGIDPISDMPAQETDCINQVRVSRCLFYVADVLKRVIDGSRVVPKGQRTTKSPFTITEAELSRYVFDPNPIPAGNICRKINALVDSDKYCRLKRSSILIFLQQMGLISETVQENGTRTFIPTQQGSEMGIIRELRKGMSGPYSVTLYSVRVQKMILENLSVIINYNLMNRDHEYSHAEMQGQPWTEEQDQRLAGLFKQEVSVSDMAITFKRTESAIAARLKKLGLLPSYRIDYDEER